MGRKYSYTTLGIFVLPLLWAILILGSPPALPAQSALTISPNGGGQVTLSWQGTNGWLQSSPSLSVVPYSWLNFPGTPLTSGATNFFTVSTSEPMLFFRLVNSPFLPPPTRLSLDVQTDGTFALAWDEVPGATSYNLYLASVSGISKTNYSILPDGAAITGLAGNYASVSSLIPGTRYYFVVTAVNSQAESLESNERTGIYGPHGGVKGSVYTLLSMGANLAQVPVPAVGLSSVNQSNPAISASASSDVQGNFAFPDQPAGDYQLCWRAPGFISGCLPQSVTITNGSVDAGFIQINALTNATNGLVYGQLLFQNGVQVFQQNAFFNVNASPLVALINASNQTVATAIVNAQGQYLIRNVPLTNSLRLQAAIENATFTTNINTFVTGEADIIFSNSPPQIHVVVATLNGAPVFRVPGGATVQVTAYADDPDGDPLTFQWYTPYGPIANATTSNISWTLPNESDGMEYLLVRASDGRGGYDNARISLNLNPALQFSGQVIDDATGLPITNALVQVNPLATNTDAAGYFSISLTATNEYDLSITSGGYIPLVKVLFDEEVDQAYRLMRISSNACLYSSLSGAFVTNASGVVLQIPQGVLVDSNNVTYSGNYSVALDSLDPCDASNSFAGGNFTSSQGALDPYCFVNIMAQDCNGALLFLRPSASASLFLPVSAACSDASNAPALAQFFSLSPFTNRWTLVGSAAKTPGTNAAFQGNLLAFGPVIAATPKGVGALLISADRTLHVPFTVGIFKTNGTDLIKYEDILYQTPQDLNGNPNTNVAGQVVSGLPEGPVLVKILDLRQSPGEFFDQGVNVPRASKTIIQIITNTVTANTTNIVLAGLGVGAGRAAQLADLTADEVRGLNFLNLRDISKDIPAGATDPNSGFNQYYSLVDPGNLKDTFAKWQTANGWATNGAGVGNFEGTNAGKNDDAFGLYFNATELGAGRRMGMKTNGNNIAYYVATYASLADAEAAKNLKYIVCMEYSPHPTLDKTNAYIKFYAYAKDGSRTGIVPDEDRHRPTYVPYVCMVCHGGGSYDPKATLAKTTNNPEMKVRKGDVDGQFIGFDTAGYTFSAAGGFTRADLFAKNIFKTLNQGLLKSARIMPADNILKNLVTTLLAGNTNYTAAPPTGWETDTASAKQYNHGYAVSCRSCHSTQGGNRWSNTNEFYKTGYGGSPTESTWGIMPQPQRTYAVYWGSATASKINTNVYNAPAAMSRTQTGFVP